MEDRWGVLLVSARLENRRALQHILEGLPILVFTASTIQQARDALSGRPIRLVFCEESFADGSYRDLLASIHTTPTSTLLVLILSTGEWDEYLEAMRLGARDVIRCPLQPTDVELVLIRAARDFEAAEHGHLGRYSTENKTNSFVQAIAHSQVA